MSQIQTEIKNRVEEIKELAEKIKLNNVAETLWDLLQSIRFIRGLEGAIREQFYSGPFAIDVYGDELTISLPDLNIQLKYKLVSEKPDIHDVADAVSRKVVNAVKNIAEDIVRLNDFVQECQREEEEDP